MIINNSKPVIKEVMYFTIFTILCLNFFSVYFTSIKVNATGSGSILKPFTSLVQAGSIMQDGKYYFNINGQTFITRVNIQRGGGWILVAAGNSATTETSYTTSTNLDLRSDKILPTSVISTLTDTHEVRINATNRPQDLDIVSRDPVVINRLLNYTTLSFDQINNEVRTQWSGFETGNPLAKSATPCVGTNTTLDKSIIQNCGNNAGINWSVSLGREASRGTNRSDNLHLWVRAKPPKTIQRIAVFYSGINSSFTTHFGMRILDQNGSPYPNRAWIITSAVSTAVDNLVGQFPENADLRADTNANAQITLQWNGVGAPGGFRGFITQQLRQDKTSTRLQSSTVTYLGGATVVNSYSYNPILNYETTYNKIPARIF
jgi:hypothetical protein